MTEVKNLIDELIFLDSRLEQGYIPNKTGAILQGVILALKKISEKDKWHIVADGDLPAPEERVLAKCIRKYADGRKKMIIAAAMYEDGTILDCDSKWHWEDIEYAGWNEEKDCGIVPRGWYEYCIFTPDGALNYAIDCEVVEWMPLPESWMEE